MKRLSARVACIGLATLLLASTAAAQNPPAGHVAKTLGIGMQASFPVYGASVIYNTNSRISLQGIIGAFGTLKEYGGRVLYRFDQNKNLQPYAFGMAGAWSYDGYRIDNTGYGVAKTTETVPGFGAGAGVEYFFESLPDLGFNAEIGMGTAKFKEVNYSYSAISFGVGLHYYFR